MKWSNGWVEYWRCDECGDVHTDIDGEHCYTDPDTDETFCGECVEAAAPGLCEEWLADCTEVAE